MLLRILISGVIGLVWLGTVRADEGVIRQGQVAGQFYPADSALLSEVVSSFLDGASAKSLASKPRILIAPHAGYPYSGPVAAEAFSLIQGHYYDAVVVVGFTHRQSFIGASIDNAQAYETPLGTIPVDQETTEFLRLLDERLHYRADAHEANEHSLEVMLPFLQTALGDFQLIPILMGSASMEDAEVLAQALAALSARGDTLFVFSSDLSHYHPYETAQRIDERTLQVIEQETPQAAHRLFSSGALEACGRGPIVASLVLADQLGYLSRKRLHYANSGDTAGDRSQVVGYGAVAMYERNAPSDLHLISDQAGQALVKAARWSLEQGLTEDEVLADENLLASFPELEKAQGLFVTLRKAGQLRGCIGRVNSDEALADSISKMAMSAALQDERFSPVTFEELDYIHLEVSVLTQPTLLTDVNDLVPGRDGVVLTHKGRSGVFLPKVWESTGWTREEFLRELASQKAGLEPGAWREARLEVFQEQIFYELVTPH